jgi:hypothetical protein
MTVKKIISELRQTERLENYRYEQYRCKNARKKARTMINNNALEVEAFLKNRVVCDPELIKEWVDNEGCIVLMSKC